MSGPLRDQPRIHRLKLPSQIWIKDDIDTLDLALDLTTVPMEHLPHLPPLTEKQKQDSFLTVHYVELQPYRPNSCGASSDGTISLKGSQSLVQTVDVLHKDPLDAPTAPARPVKIIRSQVCGSGSHVLTLSFTKTRAHLDLWKLVDLTRATATATSAPESKGQDSLYDLSQLADDHPWVAHTEFLISRNGAGNPPSLEIALSYDASRVAVFPSIDLDRSEFPDVAFRLFEYSQQFTPALRDEKGPTSPTGTFTSSTGLPERNHPLHGFAGYGRFHILDWEKKRSSKLEGKASGNRTAHGTDISQEAFVACDGLTVSVYKVQGSWRRTFDLKLSEHVTIAPRATPFNEDEDERTPEEKFQIVIQTGAKLLIGSLRGPLCVWANIREFSVWDLRQGRLRSNSPMSCFSVDNSITDISLSSDGLLTTIAGTFTFVFNTMTGTNIQYMYAGACGMSTRFLDDCHLLWYSVSGQPSTIMNLSMGDRFSDQKLQIPYSDFGVQQLFSVDTPDEAQDIGLQLDVDNGPGSVTSDEKSVDSSDEHQRQELLWQKCRGSTSRDLILLAQGSSLSVYGLKETIALATTDNFNNTPTLEIDTTRCTSACLRPHILPEERKPQELVSVSGYRYSIRLTPGRAGGMTLTLQGPDEKEAPKLIQYLRAWGRWTDFEDAYFLPCKTRFLAWSTRMIWVWRLPPDPSNDLRCELLAMRSVTAWKEKDTDLDWQYQRDVVLCEHGNSVRYYIDPNFGEDKHRYFEFQTQHLMNPEHIRDAVVNVHYLAGLYGESKENPRHQQEILRYMAKYTGCHPDIYNSTYTVFDEILQNASDSWTSWIGFDIFLRDLLRTEIGGDKTDDENTLPWYPSVSSGKNLNPIMRVLNKAKLEPKLLDLAVILMDYCLRMAKREHDVGFLSVILEILPDLINQEPDLAREVMYRCAFIQVKERSYVVRRAEVKQAPRFSDYIPLWPWKSRPKDGEESRCVLFDISQARQGSVVFQIRPVVPSNLQLETEEEAKLNDKFVAYVYVAPFQLLWHVQNRHSQDSGPGSEPLKLKAVNVKTTWWGSLIWMVALNLLPKKFQYIRSHALDLEFFDNPAIAALLEYKWNAFARSYWMARFVSQCLYYILVLAVTFCQVYLANPEDLKLAFVGIIAVSAVFLWLEFQQCLQNPHGYLTSPYNYVDIVVFALPLAASAVQISEITQNGDDLNYSGNTRAFSFSILVIYLHLLFELRVIESVCKFVTIILSVMKKIRAFFIIFAISIVAFSHAFLHLLWGRTFGTENQADNAADFTKSFPAAVSATYFFMGGRYDPVADKFASNDIAFHIMMIIYFFMTVILMINVLIALINVAFNTGDDSWRLVWIENRLRSIENAENMSFHIPGFRRTYPWFPSEIYYTAPAKQVQEYTTKYLQKDLLFAVPLHNPELAQLEDPAKDKDIFPTIPEPEPESKTDQTTGSEDAVHLITLSSSTSEEGGTQLDVAVEDMNLGKDTTTDMISAMAVDNTISLGLSTTVSPPAADQELLTKDTTFALLEELQSLKAMQEESNRRQDELQSQLEQVLTLLRQQKEG
ncbi:hypothetical protein BGZ72_010659 [Mortierella alpina]|nr:hypothetical protein BGZ72_010659 [Mortierella alpina]